MHKIAALVLAAGSSQRMPAQNKLLAEVDGRGVLASVLEAATQSTAESVLVVTGYDAVSVCALARQFSVDTCHNPEFADGIATSIGFGLSSLPKSIDAVIVLLGDMPFVSARQIDRLLGAYDPATGNEIVMPVYDGRRGNPVIFSRCFFPEISALSGDRGARRILEGYPENICEVEMGDGASLFDIDTIEDLERANTRSRY